MGNLESAFGRWVIKLRWVIIPVTLLALFLAASGAQYLSFTSNYRVYFSEDNPQLQAFEAMEATYTKDDNVLIVLTPSNGDVFTRDTLALRMKEDDWRAVIDTNLSSAFYLAKAALRGMLRQNFGRIINISSVSGLMGNAGQSTGWHRDGRRPDCPGR